jgi:hypothetical protein
VTEFGSERTTNGRIVLRNDYKNNRRLVPIPVPNDLHDTAYNAFIAVKNSTQLTAVKQWTRGLRRGSAAVRLLGLWFESRRGHGCLSVVSVVCCQVEVSATV